MFTVINKLNYVVALNVLDEYHSKPRPFGNASFKGWCQDRLKEKKEMGQNIKDEEEMVCVNSGCEFCNPLMIGFCSKGEEPQIYNCDISVVCSKHHEMAKRLEKKV